MVGSLHSLASWLASVSNVDSHVVLCLSISDYDGSNPFVKAGPVFVGVALSVGFGVDELLSAVGTFLDVDFQSASCACVLAEHVVDPARVLRVESLLDLGGVPEVASAATVLNVDGVFGSCRSEVVYGCF